MKYRLVVFDFDGTLADSFPWFLRVMNDVADRYRFRRMEPQELDALRSLGSREILTELGVPAWKLPFVAAHLRKLKAAHRREIALFPGVDAMLARLKAGGVTIAIVSSDAESNVRTTLGKGNATAIAAFACGASMFGKAARFRKVIALTGIPAEAGLVVGDEVRDADAAESAGIAFGAVTWGYAAADALERQRPAEIFASVGEIADKVLGAVES